MTTISAAGFCQSVILRKRLYVFSCAAVRRDLTYNLLDVSEETDVCGRDGSLGCFQTQRVSPANETILATVSHILPQAKG